MLFGSAVLDTALGVILCFLLIGLITSVLQEVIATVLGWRAATLKDGIGRLLADPNLSGIGGEILAHGLLQGLKTKRGVLSYLPSTTFADALVDLLFRPTVDGSPGAPARPTYATAHLISTIQQAKIPDGLRQSLTSLANTASSDVAAFKTKVAAWFDSAMERVSGEYKRRTQYWQVGIAFILAIALNISTINVATTLWRDPALRQAVAAEAEPLVRGGNTPQATDVSKVLDKLPLPIGWTAPPKFSRDAWCSWLTMIAGWMLTGFSAFFGAPFWFDLLTSVVNLRGTGPKPQPASDSQT
jgi:hypothetical protein